MNLIHHSNEELLNRFTVFQMTLFVLLIIMAFVFQQVETLSFGAILSAIYAVWFVDLSKIQKDTFLVVLLFITLCLPSILSMNHGLSSVFYLFSTIAVFFAAKRFCQHSLEELLACFRIVFVLAVGGVFYVLFEYWGYPEPFGEVIPGSSTNGIPSYLIVLQVTLSIVTFLARHQLPLISPILTLMVAFFGLGRGSLVASALILVASVLCNFILGKVSMLQRALVIICLVAGLVTIALNWSLLLEVIVDGTKLREGLYDPYRMEIFYQYLDKIDAWSLISGAEYTGTVIESQYNENPHIAFIRTHAYFGLIGLLLVILSPALIVISNRSRSDKIVVFIFIGFAFFRALSEPILFPTLLDFFYFSWFFIFFKYASRGRVLGK